MLYTALVGTSISLAVKNPIYAIVAIAFMVPAEKFIKKLFGINAETTSGMGSFAAGALGMAGLKQIANMGKKAPTKLGGNTNNKSNGDNGDSSDDRNYIREANSDSLALFGDSSKDEKGTKTDNGGQPPPKPVGNNEIEEAKNDDERDWLQPNKEDGLEQEKSENQIRDEVRDEYGLNGLEDPTKKYDIGYQAERQRREKAAEEEIQKRIAQQKQLQGDKKKEENTKKKEMKPAEHWRRNYALSRAKDMAPTVFKAAKGTARIATKAAGTMAGATIGLAAGATTGDMGKAISYMTAGGAAGNMIGGNAVNFAGAVGSGMLEMPGKFERRDEKIEYMRDEAKYGAEIARQRKIEKNNAAAEAKFLNNKKEQAKWEDVRGKLTAKGYQGSTKDLMKVVSSYKRAGVKDDEMIENALNVEQSLGTIGKGNNHEKVKAITSFAAKNKLDRSFVTDSDKNKSYQKLLKQKIKTEEGQKEANDMFTKLMGF